MTPAYPRTEQQLLDAVVDLAKHCRWAVHHCRPARTGHGYATPIQGHKGFPDLVLARSGVVLFRELKGYDRRGRLGRLTAEQRNWARQLAPDWPDTASAGRTIAGGLLRVDPLRITLPFDVWTPDDWSLIVATLTARPARRTA